MNYLLDRKLKQRKYLKLSLVIPVLIILIYFHAGIFRGLSTVGLFVFRPFLTIGGGAGDKFSDAGSFFSSKKTLTLENEELKQEVDSTAAKLANYDLLLDENTHLKEVLGRKKEAAQLILASIMSKPNQNPYDTLLIDVGNDKGIKAGNTVFALGNIPIGRVDMVYGYTSKVVLFSTPGERTEVIVPLVPTTSDEPIDSTLDANPVDNIMPDSPPDSAITPITPDATQVALPVEPVIKKSGKNIFSEAVGRGGGNFEILLPRDLSLEKGSEVTLPGINSYVVGIMEEVISDPRDSFQKALLVSPVNIQEIKFVEVQI